jgi:hypothetical protein
MLDLTKKYRTRDGREVRCLRRLDYTATYPLVGFVDYRQLSWMADGKYHESGTDPHLDLVPEPEPLEVRVAALEKKLETGCPKCNPPKPCVVPHAGYSHGDSGWHEPPKFVPENGVRVLAEYSEWNKFEGRSKSWHCVLQYLDGAWMTQDGKRARDTATSYRRDFKVLRWRYVSGL